MGFGKHIENPRGHPRVTVKMASKKKRGYIPKRPKPTLAQIKLANNYLKP